MQSAIIYIYIYVCICICVDILPSVLPATFLFQATIKIIIERVMVFLLIPKMGPCIPENF